MAWFRRRRPVAAAGAGPSALPDLAIAPRLERALVALAVHAQQLDTRLDRIERRLDDDRDSLLDVPTQADMIDLQMHTARVSAELTRLAVELRAEIEAVASRARGDDPLRAQRLELLAPRPEPRRGALHAGDELPPAASA